MFLKAVVELLLMLLTLKLTPTAATDLSPWSFSECKLSGSLQKKPISDYTPNILNLKRQWNLSPNIWLMFYGVVHNMEICGLHSGYLYSVTRKDTEEPTFDFTRGTTTMTCPGRHIMLDEGSYGFVSCAEDESAAIEASDNWWWDIPISYITIILILVAVLIVLIAITATVIFIVRRRRSRQEADLFPSSKRVVMRPVRDDCNYA